MIWRDDYFEWMYELVCDRRFSKDISFRELLSLLDSIRFTYRIANDVNRAKDGVDLRRRYGFIKNEPYSYTAPCSVLEMLVALAIRCEESLMSDTRVGDRTSHWFWSMIGNLGLGTMTDEYFDEKYVKDTIRQFLNREYAPNGKGGLFTVRNRPEKDLRDVEIWMQLCWYLDELVG